MITPELLRRLEAMERRAEAMQTLARMLWNQVEQQRQEIASIKAQCSSEGKPHHQVEKARVEAPSLAAMLRTNPR
jgi:hypothetical protein